MVSLVAAMGVGVGNSQPGQNGALLGLHRFGLRVRQMIVSQKMKDAMGGQVLKMMRQRLALFGGFARTDSARQGNVAELAGRAGRSWKGEHIGGGVLAPEPSVQRLLARIVGEQDRKLDAGGSAHGFQGG